MKISLSVSCAFLLAGIAAPLQAADPAAGQARACASCHGENGISVSDDIPNLAGQKEAYLANQLKAFRQGTRKNQMMNAIAAQLSDTDIEDLAAFWSGRPAGAAEASTVPAHIARTRLRFPEGYQKNYTHYTTINFPDRKQVRKYYANPTALEAARAGRPLPEGSVLLVEVYSTKLDDAKKPVTGSDGFFVPEKLIFYTGMETRPGWGADFPELLRNGDWNYAVFTADKQVRSGVNQAQCLACHKPLDKDSYVFSLAALKEKAGSSR